jgi:hypothetical protein
MLPKAELSSCVADRLRLRIPSRRGDRSYFDDLRERWLKEFPDADAVCNVMTGSVVVTGTALDPNAIAEFGRRQTLFDWKPDAFKGRSWTGGVETITLSLNRKIRNFSAGTLDLTSGLFMALMIFGIIELLRGRWKSPPWYTAFWYAFGVYSKAVVDQAARRRSDTPTSL